MIDDVPLRQKILIGDDTNLGKTDHNMELVSYHFDHTKKRSVLGYRCLQLGYHNGVNFFPLDMTCHVSQKRPNNRLRQIDKRTTGSRRRKEAFHRKADALVEMVRRVWIYGIDASFVVFDS